MANTLVNLAAVHRAAGRAALARPLLDEAIRTQQELLTRDPRSTDLRRELAFSQESLGLNLGENDHDPRGAASTREAPDAFRLLSAENPDNPRYRYYFARTCVYGGKMAADVGR